MSDLALCGTSASRHGPMSAGAKQPCAQKLPRPAGFITSGLAEYLLSGSEFGAGMIARSQQKTR
jgi:hypothetical protein